MNVQQELEELMLAYEGVCAIIITDHDGALILNVGLPSTLDNSRFRQQLIVSHLTTIPQIHKLHLGGHKTTFALYETHQIAVHSLGKYFFIVHAGANANTGAMLAMREKLVPIADHLLIVCPPIDGDGFVPLPSVASASAAPTEFFHN
ncbi:unnamed protein product [Caenorhabditis sp. 36 PRJEB53466]|nr:unnamed protein product [Caenorhabditis sp. 36 PRJEB53466]